MSLGFLRQEYWSGLPFPSPEDLPDPGIGPVCHACQWDSLPSEPSVKPLILASIQTSYFTIIAEHAEFYQVGKRHFHQSPLLIQGRKQALIGFLTVPRFFFHVKNEKDSNTFILLLNLHCT